MYHQCWLFICETNVYSGYRLINMFFFDDIGPLDLAFTLLLTFQLLKWKCQYIVVNISPLDDISEYFSS